MVLVPNTNRSASIPIALKDLLKVDCAVKQEPIKKAKNIMAKPDTKLPAKTKMPLRGSRRGSRKRVVPQQITTAMNIFAA
jgi:hypothetical protein